MTVFAITPEQMAAELGFRHASIGHKPNDCPYRYEQSLIDAWRQGFERYLREKLAGRVK
jgi:predicted TPR repeat methyltransferase